jgi:SAM-dependent methyltransferase
LIKIYERSDEPTEMTGKPFTEYAREWLSFMLLTGFISPLQRIANRRRSSYDSWDLFYKYLPGFEFLCPRDSALMSMETFISWGYYPTDNVEKFTDFVSKLPLSEQKFPYCAYQYYRLLEKGRPENKSILEVGCGKGAGCRYVVDPFFSPKKYVGLDLSFRQIKLCKAHNLDKRYHFLEGTALSLPFASNSFDIVLNVESSHCYPSFKGFLREVERVLRPGGMFLFNDLRVWQGNDIGKSLEKQLNSTDMEVVTFTEITDNIFAARKMISKHITNMDNLIFKYNQEFANSSCLEGSVAYEWLKNGKMKYFEAILEKKMLPGGEL